LKLCGQQHNIEQSADEDKVKKDELKSEGTEEEAIVERARVGQRLEQEPTVGVKRGGGQFCGKVDERIED